MFNRSDPIPNTSELYDDSYLLSCQSIIKDSTIHSQVNLLKRILPSLEKSKRVIDIGCGTGRHLRALATRETSCLGIDSKKEFIEVARRECTKVPHAKYICADYRNLAKHCTPGSFDVALSLFSSIGHVSWDDEAKLFQDIRLSLKPKGYFILQHENIAWHTQRHDDHWWHNAGELVRLGHSIFNATSGLLEVEEKLFRKGEEFLFKRWSIRIYALSEIAFLFSQAGFSIEKVADEYGNSTLSPLTARWYVVGRKKT